MCDFQCGNAVELSRSIVEHTIELPYSTSMHKHAAKCLRDMVTLLRAAPECQGENLVTLVTTEQGDPNYSLSNSQLEPVPVLCTSTKHLLDTMVEMTIKQCTFEVVSVPIDVKLLAGWCLSLSRLIGQKYAHCATAICINW